MAGTLKKKGEYPQTPQNLSSNHPSSNPFVKFLVILEKLETVKSAHMFSMGLCCKTVVVFKQCSMNS